MMGSQLPFPVLRLILGVALMLAAPAAAQKTSGAGAGTGIAAVQAQTPVALGAALEEYPDRTRFLLELSDPIAPRVFTLADPDRVVIALPELLWRVQSADRPGSKSLVKSYRYGQFRAGESRIVIDLNAPVAAREAALLPPSHGNGYRIAIDLVPATQEKFEEGAGWPSDMRVRPPAPREALQVPSLRGSSGGSLPAAEKRIIVIDPGHGGIDAGTTGVDGLREKDVVLDEAKRLAAILEKRSYSVRLTRDNDVYIPLRERVEIARRANADLFVSLHADSNPDADMTGASVYTLSERGSSREAAALARKENQSDVVAGVNLSGQDDTVAHILIELAQRGTMTRSVHFADALVAELSRGAGVIARDPHRSAAFVVLKAPDVPSVLVELGYLSNARDCGRMGTGAWRNGVAAGLARAIDRYFQSETAAAQPLSLGR